MHITLLFSWFLGQFFRMDVSLYLTFSVKKREWWVEKSGRCQKMEQLIELRFVGPLNWNCSFSIYRLIISFFLFEATSYLRGGTPASDHSLSLLHSWVVTRDTRLNRGFCSPTSLIWANYFTQNFLLLVLLFHQLQLFTILCWTHNAYSH